LMKQKAKSVGIQLIPVDLSGRNRSMMNISSLENSGLYKH
jgi:hypothetical protein